MLLPFEYCVLKILYWIQIYGIQYLERNIEKTFVNLKSNLALLYIECRKKSGVPSKNVKFNILPCLRKNNFVMTEL